MTPIQKRIAALEARKRAVSDDAINDERGRAWSKVFNVMRAALLDGRPGNSQTDGQQSSKEKVDLETAILNLDDHITADTLTIDDRFVLDQLPDMEMKFLEVSSKDVLALYARLLREY